MKQNIVERFEQIYTPWFFLLLLYRSIIVIKKKKIIIIFIIKSLNHDHCLIYLELKGESYKLIATILREMI